VRYRRRELIRWADEKLELHTSERELPEEQTPAATAEAASQPARQPAPVTRQTAPPQAKANPAPVANPAQTEPAPKAPRERKRNPFDPFNLMNS
jgi:hypothetical protein